MSTTHPQIEIVAGDLLEIVFMCTDGAGAALPLAGAVVEWKLSDFDGVKNVLTYTTPAPQITIADAAAGKVIVNAPTADLLAGFYRDQLRVTLAGATEPDTQAQGLVLLKQAL